jgi:hypothetical protein
MPRTARRIAPRPVFSKRGFSPLPRPHQGRAGRTKGGRKAKLHAVRDGQGRPVALLLTEGQARDHRGAALLLHKLPLARERIADRG